MFEDDTHFILKMAVSHEQKPCGEKQTDVRDGVTHIFTEYTHTHTNTDTQTHTHTHTDSAVLKRNEEPDRRSRRRGGW